MLDTYRYELDSALHALLQGREAAPHAALFAAAHYSLFPAGKRLRPLLLMATATAFGAPLKEALLPACAIELIHTYSLIHDDLPSMDDDALRRNRPTLHRVYGEGHAILTGDFLLTHAFQLLAGDGQLAPAKRVALIHCLASCSGGEGMIAGQVVDIAHQEEGPGLSPALLVFSYRTKTAALMAAALEMGGLVGDASPLDLQLLRRAGLELGLAFQYRDDLEDAGGSSSLNALSLLGREETEARAHAHTETALHILALLPCAAPILQALCAELLGTASR